MGFRRQDLQEAFFVPGTHPFRVWGYGTTDALEEVLRPNYLRGGQAMVQLGELIYVCTRPGRDPVDGREAGEVRAALVMVSGFARGDASLRLVQDFGCAREQVEDRGGVSLDGLRASPRGPGSLAEHRLAVEHATAARAGQRGPPGLKSGPRSVRDAGTDERVGRAAACRACQSWRGPVRRSLDPPTASTP